MKFDDILSLAKAGFTAEQITKLAAIPQTNAAVQQTNAVIPQTNAAVQQTNLQPQTGINQPNAFDMLCNAVAGQMQQQNVINSTMPKEETVEDILASLVAPPTVKE